MSLNYDDVVRTGVAKQIAESIRAAIVSGRLTVDERLPTEDELAQRYSVSRPTIREALKRLAAQNLIWSRRGPTGGSFVNRPDPEGLSQAITGAATLLVGMGVFEIEEMFSARLETETICCRLAVQNRTEQDLVLMQAELVTQSDETITDEAFCASDVRLHRAIVNSGKNTPLQLMMYTVIEAFMPITNMVIFRIRDRQQIVAFHKLLVAAIAAQDSDGARAVLTDLLSYTKAIYPDAVAARHQQKSDPA